jgi:predicted nucleic acid-binding protein
VQERVLEDGAYAPDIWKLEVGNTLLLAERHGRIAPEHRARALQQLSTLPIAVDLETAGQAWSGTWQLAQRFRLTLYDAAYLELAQRRALPLATLDRDLRRGAETLGIELLGV